MKKVKDLLFCDGARMTYAALLIFFATFCVFPSAGWLSTLPLVPLAGLLAPLFYDEAKILVPAAALSSVLLALTLTEGYDAHVFYAIVPTLFFLAAHFVLRLLRLFSKGEEKRIGALSGVFGLVVLLLMWFVVFSNPFTLKQVTDESLARYNACYHEEFFVTGTRYDPLTQRVLTDYRTEKTAFSAFDGEDGYQALVEKEMLERQKAALLSLLHAQFSDGNYHVSVDAPEREPFGTRFSYDAPPEEWYSQHLFTLEFDSAIAVGTPDARAAFASRIREYVTLINEEGFPYASFTFRGGEHGEMVYELTATPDTPIDELVAPNVKDLTR